MFEQKQSSLLNSDNKFVKEGLKVSSEITSENGAKKYSTTGNDFVDNFASISYFKELRLYNEVAKDMQLLWSQNPLLCIKLTVYIRLITRKTRIIKSKSYEELNIQRGAGLKNEGILRILWIAINHPNTFKANIPYFIAAGSYKDIIQLLSIDLQYNGWNNRNLDWDFLGNVLFVGLANPNTTHLVRKYLPTIRTNKKCTTLESQADTLIGRWIASRVFHQESNKNQRLKCYRQMKSQGKAHQWQQLISQQLYDQINFDTIAGRALSLLVNSKFLENHNLVENYKKWIFEKDTANFTGFVFELFKEIDKTYPEDYKIATINAQFNKLLEGTNIQSNLLVVRDTSGSMSANAIGCSVSADCIAKSLALYFSYFLKGEFANTFAEFNETCVLHQWKGNNPVEKYINDDTSAIASTNFQSVIDLFIRLHYEGVPEEDFPTGILCISDGELDNCGSETNFQKALNRLRMDDFSEEYVNNFKIILWDIPNSYYGVSSMKFEDFADSPNFFYISGYDPSVVTFILGGDNPKFKAPKTAEELFLTAMNQDILNKLTIED